MAHRRTPQKPAGFSAEPTSPAAAETNDEQSEPVIGAFLGGPLGALIGEILRSTVRVAMRTAPAAPNSAAASSLPENVSAEKSGGNATKPSKHSPKRPRTRATKKPHTRAKRARKRDGG